jgi:glycosyltransferase involved in cell wall biosynthesis
MKSKSKLKMKIAQVIGTYEYGGIGTIVTDIAHGLKKEGHEVEIVCVRKRLKPKKVRVVSFDSKLKPTIFWGTLKMIKYLRKFDIVHVHGSLPIIYTLFKRKNQKVVYTHHGWHIGVTETEFKTKIGSAFFLKLYQLVATKIDIFIGISKWAQKEIKLFFNRNSFLLRNPINAKKFVPKKVSKSYKIGNPMILSVGRNRPHKGHIYEILAMKEVVKKYPDAKLVIVGEDYQRLIPIVKKLNIENNVVFLGKVKDKQLVSLYNACNIYVSASFWELFGLTFLEALFCGKPIIARNSFAMTELVKESKAGILFNKNEEISQAIVECLKKEKEFKENAMIFRKKYIKQNNWKEYIRKLIKIYRK